MDQTDRGIKVYNVKFLESKTINKFVLSNLFLVIKIYKIRQEVHIMLILHIFNFSLLIPNVSPKNKY